MLICHLPLGPTAYFTLSNVVMRHDIEDRATVSEAFPHLILDGFESQLGKYIDSVSRLIQYLLCKKTVLEGRNGGY